MRVTCQSEVGKIKNVFIKNVNDAFVSEAVIDRDWKALGFLSRPDFAAARKEYQAFESALQLEGAMLSYFPKDDQTTIDSIYCRDAAIATDHGMILCQMGKPARKNEPAAEGRAFEAAGMKILGRITAPGTVEGGDVAWIDEKTLAVGYTYRTNPEGIRQLTELLSTIGVEVITVNLPHYKGPSDVFHLMSILSPVNTRQAVVYSPLMPINFRNELIRRGYELIEVPDQEFEAMGCNVLALSPGHCLMAAGSPLTRSALEKAGCRVVTYKGDEISVKGGGGPTCLTRPVLREIAAQ